MKNLLFTSAILLLNSPFAIAQSWNPNTCENRSAQMAHEFVKQTLNKSCQVTRVIPVVGDQRYDVKITCPNAEERERYTVRVWVYMLNGACHLANVLGNPEMVSGH